MTNIIIVGVGGQGTLLASKVLGAYASLEGLDVKVSEVHGMAQRGGSVITHVRIGAPGERVHAPLIDAGDAHFVVAFELLEALRVLPYLRDDGVIVVNNQRILPMPVITGAAQYPQDALERIKSAAGKATVLDAHELALKAGSARSANIVLLGVLKRFMGGTDEVWRSAIASSVPAHTLNANNTAFELGRTWEM